MERPKSPYSIFCLGMFSERSDAYALWGILRRWLFPGRKLPCVVEKAIVAAKSEILMACYEFTSPDIAEALDCAAHRGVKVRIAADWRAAQDRQGVHDRAPLRGLPRHGGYHVHYLKGGFPS
jgi:hypothetical protein